MDIFNYVCGYAHVMYVQMPAEASDCGSGTRVAGTCQPPDAGLLGIKFGASGKGSCVLHH